MKIDIWNWAYVDSDTDTIHFKDGTVIQAEREKDPEVLKWVEEYINVLEWNK